MDPLVNVDGIFPSYHFIDGRASLLLLTTFLCRSHLSNAEKHPCMHQTRTQLPSDFSCHLPSHHPQLLTSHKIPTFRNLNLSLIHPRGRTSCRFYTATFQHHKCFTLISLTGAQNTSETRRPLPMKIGFPASPKRP